MYLHCEKWTKLYWYWLHICRPFVAVFQWVSCAKYRLTVWWRSDQQVSAGKCREIKAEGVFFHAQLHYGQLTRFRPRCHSNQCLPLSAWHSSHKSLKVLDFFNCSNPGKSLKRNKVLESTWIDFWKLLNVSFTSRVLHTLQFSANA